MECANGLQDVLAEFIPRIPLGEDVFCEALGTVTAICFLDDFKQQFSHTLYSTHHSRVPERAIALVVEQNILAPGRDEDVVESVVVVIAHGNARRPNAAAKAGLSGHILERPIAIVVIETDCGFGRVGPERRRPVSMTMSSQPSLS